MKTNQSRFVTLAISLFVGTTAVSSATVYIATLNSLDSIVGNTQGTGPALGYSADAGNNQVGTGGAANNRAARNLVIGFTLPVLDGPIDSVMFSIKMTAPSGTLATDLFGLATANPDGSGTTNYLAGPASNDTTNTLLKSAFATNTSSQVNPLTESMNTRAFIQSLYTGVNPNQAEVFFRINPNTEPALAGITRLTFDLASPILTINTIPEPSALTLLGVCGALTLFRRKRA